MRNLMITEVELGYLTELMGEQFECYNLYERLKIMSDAPQEPKAVTLEVSKNELLALTCALGDVDDEKIQKFMQYKGWKFDIEKGKMYPTEPDLFCSFPLYERLHIIVEAINK